MTSQIQNSPLSRRSPQDCFVLRPSPDGAAGFSWVEIGGAELSALAVTPGRVKAHKQAPSSDVVNQLALFGGAVGAGEGKDATLKEDFQICWACGSRMPVGWRVCQECGSTLTEDV
jgi:hypothetical protein